MSDHHITLGGQKYEVKPPPLGVMKKLTPAVIEFSRVSVEMGSFENVTEADFDRAILILSLALGMTIAEVEALPGVGLAELIDGVHGVARASGLVARVEQPGEQKPAAIPATDSTPSTA